MYECKSSTCVKLNPPPHPSRDIITPKHGITPNHTFHPRSTPLLPSSHHYPFTSLYHTTPLSSPHTSHTQVDISSSPTTSDMTVSTDCCLASSPRFASGSCASKEDGTDGIGFRYGAASRRSRSGGGDTSWDGRGGVTGVEVSAKGVRNGRQRYDMTRRFATMFNTTYLYSTLVQAATLPHSSPSLHYLGSR